MPAAWLIATESQVNRNRRLLVNAAELLCSNDNEDENENCAAELRLIVAERQVNSDGVAG